MKTTFRLKEKKDIKTFILYMLMLIDRPIDMPTVNDIIVQDDFVGQFDFMDAFYELCASGAVTRAKSGETDVFSISPKGRAAAEMLEGDILGAIKERAAASAMRLLSFERRGSRAHSEIIENGGAVKLFCSVYDKNGKQMSLELALDSKKQAEAMKANFDEKPEFVYRALLGVMSGDINYLAEAWADGVGTEDEN